MYLILFTVICTRRHEPFCGYSCVLCCKCFIWVHNTATGRDCCGRLLWFCRL